MIASERVTYRQDLVVVEAEVDHLIDDGVIQLNVLLLLGGGRQRLGHQTVELAVLAAQFDPTMRNNLSD